MKFCKVNLCNRKIGLGEAQRFLYHLNKLFDIYSITQFLIDYKYFVFYYCTTLFLSDRALDMSAMYIIFSSNFAYLFICLFIHICLMCCIVIICLWYLLID